MEKTAWSENIILIDADYADRVAFNLSVNFERMLGRRIPKADLAQWLDYLSLDGGLRPGENQVGAVFLHSPEKKVFDNFSPANFQTELDGKAFKDNLGEFTLHSFAAESIVSPIDFFLQAIEAVGQAKEVKRLLVVGDMENHASAIKQALKKLPATEDHVLDVILFAMEPQAGWMQKQEILGYSLMAALGISGEELS